MTNNYQKIKDFINSKLLKSQCALEINSINDEINRIKIAISSDDGFITVATVLSLDNTRLTDDEWSRMQRELEQHFDVKMNDGVIIQGEEQRKRDTTWWTDNYKQKTDNYYWERYKEYISDSFAPDVVRTLDIDSDNIMNNLENPTHNSFNIYGMVVGHVQSGKTANYSALVCKAADAGYKFIVVIAGGIKNLRNQTQERLNDAFVGINKGKWTGVGIGNSNRSKVPISLTTADSDFNNRDADRSSQGINFENINVPILLVIKKNTSTLQNVVNWLSNINNNNRISSHSMLLIDDESDYASINTKTEEDPAVINKRLRALLDVFDKRAYIAYTATPYANIFIDHEASNDIVGNDLFPRDFIYALDVPTNYFGARKVFLEDKEKYITPISDYRQIIPEKHNKELSISTLPDSLFDAIRLFMLNVAIRKLRGQENKHNSMLINVTRFTQTHQRITVVVENYVKKLREHVNTYGSLTSPENQSEVINALKQTFDNHHSDFLEYNWCQVVISLSSEIDLIVVREVHLARVVPLEYKKDTPTKAIVIGGLSLSRGFTLEGLSVSYFLRNSIYYDTLMQMSRWFGYRIGYEDLCKIYMPQSMIQYFTLIIEATEDLFEDFKKMAEAKMTPYDFGLAVRYHPESTLQVTARNKQRNAKVIYFEMKLDGCSKETVYFDQDQLIHKQNTLLINNIINDINDNPSNYKKVGNHHLWVDVDKIQILNFIEKFKVHQFDNFGIKSRMPKDFIKEYINKIDLKWDVALYNGESKNEYEIVKSTDSKIIIKKEKRKADKIDNYYEIKQRQLSSGNAESIALDDIERKKLGSNRKDTRDKMTKPLLMLHVLDLDVDGEGIKEIPAFGVSFPGGIKSGTKAILKIANTVMLQRLTEMMTVEEEDDD